MEDIKLEKIEPVRISDMIKAGLHIGHLASKWNPSVAPYIYKKYNKIHIFDLRNTLEDFRKTWDFIYKLNFSGGKILFISHDSAVDQKVIELANEYKMLYATGRWISGTLTNYTIISKRIARLNELDSMDFDNDSEYANLPKNEKFLLIKERNKLRKMISGLAKMKRLPDAILVIGVDILMTPIREAHNKSIPVIGLVDTNCDMGMIDYRFYGSDDSVSSVNLVLEITRSALHASTKNRLSKNIAIKEEVQKITTEKEKAKKETKTKEAEVKPKETGEDNKEQTEDK